jgi:fatty acid desaturase
MKLVVALVALVGCVEAWSGVPKPRINPSSTAKQAIAIPLEQAPSIQVEEDKNAWVANLDYEGFTKEVNDLGKQLLQETGEADVEHLNKILRWRDIAAFVGIATMWTTPNPLTVAALSTWTYASWTMVAHHTCHGGYNRVDAGKFNSRGFALGTVVKRIQDWCDWMAPEAWNVEHNRLHHYHLGEEKDPDLVQRNLEFLRDSQVPMYQKYAIVLALMPIWKWAYYAPNTYKELQIQKWKREQGELPAEFIPTKAVTVGNMLVPKDASERASRQIINPLDFFANVLGPFFFSRFVFLPLPLLAIPHVGPTLFTHAIINLVLADLLTNLHGFITIVTNHCGDDIYTFDDEVKPKSGSFYVRQIVGSANYKTGTDPIDFAHGWLNYQIEHHVWPDLSMLQYQRGAPQLKAICEKYGVPYVQESVWTRLTKTIDVMVGKTSMKRFPTELEPAADKAGRNGVTWKSTNGAIDEV